MLSWLDRNGQAHTVTNLGQNVCNLKNPVWQVDAGLIEDKDLLPITSIKYGGLEFEAQKAIIKVGGSGASLPPRQPRQLPWLIFETIMN